MDRKLKIYIIKTKIFFLCLIVPLLLLGGCNNTSEDDNSTEEKTKAIDTTHAISEPVPEGKDADKDRPKTGSKPYDNYFRNIKVDLNDLNCLRAINDLDEDVLISIVQSKIDKTIRCVYVRAKDNFLISRIPNGKYYIKIYYGKKWDKDKPMNNGVLKGGFENVSGFIKFPSPMSMSQIKKGDNIEYYSGEWKLYEMINSKGNSTQINEKDFFID